MTHPLECDALECTALDRDPLVAETPSLGVRLWIESNTLCVHVAYDGGAGANEGYVLLPVQWVDDRWQFKCIDGKDLAALWYEEGFLAHHLRTPSRLSTTFTERYDPQAWVALHSESECFLALVLFRNIKKPAVPPGPARKLQLAKLVLAQKLDAVEKFFRTQDPVTIDRGIFRLDKQDLPKDAAASPLDAVCFALASCKYPAGIVDGTPTTIPLDALLGRHVDPGPADAALLRLRKRLDAGNGVERPSLLVLAGDQIYADATGGLFDARITTEPSERSVRLCTPEWLRVPYENLYGSVGAQSVYGLLPTAMVLDDHEIRDNWEPLPAPPESQAERLNRALLNAGVKAYGRYQRNRVGNKPLPHQWQEYSHRGLPFFLADTRTERMARMASMARLEPRIMGFVQWAAVKKWLQLPSDRPKFFVSPAVLLPRRLTSRGNLGLPLRSDAWDGYPGSLERMLAFLCDHKINDVVFLSGDEHLSFVVEAHVCKEGVADSCIRLISVHSSGLYSPYPFANSVQEDLDGPDNWSFDSTPEDDAGVGTKYCCKVHCLRWAPGDGFACLSVKPAQSQGCWNLEIEYDRADQKEGPEKFVLTPSYPATVNPQAHPTP